MSRAPACLLAILALSLGSTTAWAAPPTKRECVEASEGGQDLRGSGKLHDARTKFAVCMAATCPRLVREDCAAQFTEIDGAMPTIVLVVRDAEGNDVASATVTIDDADTDRPIDGTAIDLDPGPHHLVVHADDRTVRRDIVAHEGDKDRRIEVTFGAAPAPPAAFAPPAAAAPSPTADADPGATQRWVGIGLGGVGAVGVIVGVVLGLVAKSTYDQAFGVECGHDPNHCTPQGASDGDSAHTLATASTATFIGAGALLAAGAALYFTAPRRAHVLSVAPQAGLGAAGLVLRGTW